MERTKTVKNDLRGEFVIGSKVRLDAEFNNTSIVEVVYQTPKKLYTTVKGGESTWDVMTYRLTPIDNE